MNVKVPGLLGAVSFGVLGPAPKTIEKDWLLKQVSVALIIQDPEVEPVIACNAAFLHVPT